MAKVIAIIDDEDEMEFLYSMLFEDAIKDGSIEIKFFSDSRDFCEWFVNHKPDLIMSDINMPHISGPELTRLIQQSGHSIQTYFVSGHEERDYSKEMKELGVCRFISKPLDFNHVLNLIGQDLNLNLS